MTYIQYLKNNCKKLPSYSRVLNEYIRIFNIDQNGIVKNKNSVFYDIRIWDLFLVDYSAWRDVENSNWCFAKIPDSAKTLFPFLKKYEYVYQSTKSGKRVFVYE